MFNHSEPNPTRHAGRGHLKPLDGIRGLAILLVLAHHAFTSNFAAAGLLGESVGEALHLARFGVDLFFVLSGFLITGILLDTTSDPQFFRKFYGRRILRIFPLYYGVLFALFLLTPLLHLHWQGMGALLALDLQNFRPAVISNLMLSPSVGLFHFWSLAIEEQFYLVWPIVVFLVRDRRQLLRLTLAVSALTLVLRIALGPILGDQAELVIRDSTICRADALLLGGVLAMLFRTAAWPRVLRLAPAIFLAAYSVIAASVLWLGTEDHLTGAITQSLGFRLWTTGFRYSVLAILFAALIAWSLRPLSRVQAAFGHPALGFFGKYSYGIYVLHVPAITLLAPPVRVALFNLTGSKMLSVVGAGTLACLAAILAAYASFHLYEKRFLRLKRFFDYNAVKPAYRDLPLGTVVLPRSSARIEVFVEDAPQHSVSIR